LKIAIIGGGITGLTAAYYLHQAGHEALVLEASDRIGGVIQTNTANGFMSESGPNSLLLNNPDVSKLFDDIKLSEHIAPANPAARNRYIVKNGRLVPVPLSPVAFLKTPLFSATAKLNLLREPLIKKANRDDEESFADFVRRRLGSEVLNFAAAPFVSGIYAGDPEKLSVRYAFPRLWALEQEYGSLVRGGLNKVKEKKKRIDHFHPTMISFAQGMKMLPQALSAALPGNSILTNTRVSAIIPGEKWRLCWSHGDSVMEDTFDGVIIAVPAHAVLGLPLPEGALTALRPLCEIEHPPISICVTGFKREQVTHPLDGFGMLIPRMENRKILGCIFSSTLFPNRAPDGHVTLTTFIGGSQNPKLNMQSSEEINSQVCADLSNLLGIKGDPVFLHNTCWERSIAQYNLGYGKVFNAIESCEQQFPGLVLAGNYRDGISVMQCIEGGLKTMKRICNL